MAALPHPTSIAVATLGADTSIAIALGVEDRGNDSSAIENFSDAKIGQGCHLLGCFGLVMVGNYIDRVFPLKMDGVLGRLGEVEMGDWKTIENTPNCELRIPHCLKLRLPIGMNEAGEDVVLPAIVDSDVIAGVTFNDETQTFEQSAAALVVGKIGSHDAMQVQLPENVIDGNRHGFFHVTPSLLGFGNAVTDGARLKRPSDKIGKVERPNDRL